MGDAGEGLVDAEARAQERMDELAAARRERAGEPIANPEAVQQRRSLELARAALSQQLAAATHPVRRAQLEAAIQELEQKLSESVGLGLSS
jgi:hypothetical protein